MADADHKQPVYTDSKSQLVQSTTNLLSKLTEGKLTILILAALLSANLYFDWSQRSQRQEWEAARDIEVKKILKESSEREKKVVQILESANQRAAAADERAAAADERERREDELTRQLLQDIVRAAKGNC